MDYEVVYSSSYTNMPTFIYANLAILIIATVIFIILLAIKSIIILNRKVKKRLAFALVLVVLLCIGNTYSYLSSVHSLKVGDYKLLYGKVENFSPASASAKGYESFQVNGKRFVYSSTLVSGGLSHSIENSGVKNGSIVKIYYKYDDILRLEVKK